MMAVVIDIRTGRPRRRYRRCVCGACGRDRRHHARGMCGDCYEIWLHRQHDTARAVGGDNARAATVRG